MSEHLSHEVMHLYLDDELNPARTAAAQAHLATCSTCRHHVAGLQQTEVLLRRMARPAPPADFTAQVMARLALWHKTGSIGHLPTTYSTGLDVQAPVCQGTGRPMQVWTGQGARWFAWSAGLAGLAILALTLAEMLAGNPSYLGWDQLLTAITAWPGQALRAPGESLAVLGSGMPGLWQGLLAGGTTALPLALALLALAGFVQMLCWLTQLPVASEQ